MEWSVAIGDQHWVVTWSAGVIAPSGTNHGSLGVCQLHSVRHSLAFWLHSLGVTPADAAALLGHTVEVHLSTYLPDSGNAGVARAAAALGLVTGLAVAE